jgi:hypothetical protein
VALKDGQQNIISAAVQTLEERGLLGVAVVFAGKLQKSLEHCVDDNYVGIEAVHSRRQDKVAAKSMNDPVPSAGEKILKKPSEKPQKLRAWDGWNLVPDKFGTKVGSLEFACAESQVLDALGIKMDFAVFALRKTLQQFGKCAFRAVAAIDKG